MSVQVSFSDHLLNYETEIIQRLAKKESLVVLAAGLPVEKLLLALIRPYCDTVLVLNFTHENDFLRQLRLSFSERKTK